MGEVTMALSIQQQKAATSSATWWVQCRLGPSNGVKWHQQHQSACAMCATAVLEWASFMCNSGPVSCAVYFEHLHTQHILSKGNRHQHSSQHAAITAAVLRINGSTLITEEA